MPYIVRKKEGTTNVVVLPFAALYYWLMWPTFIVTFIGWQTKTSVMTAATAVMWVVLIGMAVPYWPTIFKIKKMMKEKTITAKGSKYSFKNPLRYEWED